MSGAEFPHPPSRKWSLSPEVSSLRLGTETRVGEREDPILSTHSYSFIHSVIVFRKGYWELSGALLHYLFGGQGEGFGSVYLNVSHSQNFLGFSTSLRNLLTVVSLCAFLLFSDQFSLPSFPS